MRAKVILVLVFLFVVSLLLFAVPINAMQTRSTDVSFTLGFSNYTANCTCEIDADSSSDWISATMELWKGNTKLNSWSSSGMQSVSMDETENVTRYHTYRLVINYKVNGVEQSPVETSRYYG